MHQWLNTLMHKNVYQYFATRQVSPLFGRGLLSGSICRQKICFFAPSLPLLGRLVYAALDPSPTADSCQQHTRLSIRSSLLKWKKQKIMHLSFWICQSYPQMDLIIQGSAQIKFLSTPFIFPRCSRIIYEILLQSLAIRQTSFCLFLHLSVWKILALLSEPQWIKRELTLNFQQQLKP